MIYRNIEEFEAAHGDPSLGTCGESCYLMHYHGGDCEHTAAGDELSRQWAQECLIPGSTDLMIAYYDATERVGQAVQRIRLATDALRADYDPEYIPF